MAAYLKCPYTASTISQTMRNLTRQAQRQYCSCQVTAGKDVAHERWKAYIKLRKYSCLSSRHLYSSTLNGRCLASWQWMTRVRHHSDDSTHLEAASDVENESPKNEYTFVTNHGNTNAASITKEQTLACTSENGNEQKSKKKRSRKENKDNNPKNKVQTDVTAFAHLPEEVKADLKSLNHLKDDIAHSLDPNEFSSVNRQIIEEYLKQKDISYEMGHACFYMKCPRFVKSRVVKNLKETSRLYVNCASGYFECRSCGKSGKWNALVQNINDITLRKGKKPTECFMEIPAEVRPRQAREDVLSLYDSATSLTALAKPLVQEILHIFNIKRLKPKTLEQHGVRYDLNNSTLILPYYSLDKQLMGVKLLTAERVVVEDDEDAAVDDANVADVENPDAQQYNIRSSLLPRDFIGMFGSAVGNKRNRDLVLTSSEVDAMTVQQETGAWATCLPTGMASLPQEILPMLENIPQITVWFGGDTIGWENAKIFGWRLNQDRCSLIRPDKENTTAYECLEKNGRLKEILTKKSCMVHKAIVDFHQLRQEVYLEVSQSKIVDGVQWERFSPLNKVLKGHRRGELTVFTGPTGAGKTTFISDYSLDLCVQGVKTLWGSFEVNNIRLLRTMLSQYARESLSHNLEKFDYWANKFEELPMYFMTFHGQEELDNVIDTMAHAAYVYNINHVVIDNLQFMMGLARNAMDRFFQQDNTIQRLRQFATEYNIHVTLVMHPRKEVAGEDLNLASIFGGAKATQEADNVIILQDRRLTSMQGRKYIQILKNRYDGELALLGLRFNKESMSFDMLTPEDRQRKQHELEAERENHMQVELTHYM